ncbi:MAG TPA: surface-adhesin E family protein [Allosphingosinicella sp.]|nr:surface-adhesin E family protein [Allosphingosinicella sp.]
MLIAMQAPPAEWVRGDWIEVHRERNAIISVDESATRRDGDLVRIRIRGDMPDAGAGARWGLALLEIDCRSGRYRALETAEYGADGAVRDARGEERESHLPPSEPERQFMGAICHRTGWGEEGEEE